MADELDPIIGSYTESDLATASEFFDTWLPFLTRDLCSSCVDTLQSRVSRLRPSATPLSVVGATSSGTHHVLSPVDLSRGSAGASRLSWADMAAQQDDQGEEEDCEEEGSSAVPPGNRRGKNPAAVASGLSRDDRERIRYNGVVRKKDFMCYERIGGKLVNILQGLELHTGVFSAKEQSRIVGFVYDLQELGRKGKLGERTYSAPEKWMRGKGRVTLQFGCCYNYAKDRDGNPPGIIGRVRADPLPHLFKVMIKRLVGWQVLPPTCVPDSCIVNIYEPDDCIPPHIDHHDFVRPFCTVSFLSECSILFGTNLKVAGPGDFVGSFSIPLPVGSVLVLNGNGADVAKHCVPAVPSKRISITFRKMDESKRPIGFVPDPDLQNLSPLRF